MKPYRFFIYTVVLWAVVESRHAGQALETDTGGPGGNLTHKQQQEVIHADVLQHFTSTPVLPTEEVSRSQGTGHDGTSFIKDVPVIPEDINVQNLKNDDHLHIAYDRKISIDKDSHETESPLEKNKSVRINTNDATLYRYSQSGHSSSTRSEILTSRSTFEHSSTSVAYDDEDSEYKQKEKDSRDHLTLSSTTETLKSDSIKNFEIKKKGKKEIPDSVTVPTDYGSGRIEKPYKDISFSVKLKEKNKDSISEALDERRSTTIRNSDSSSISVSDSKPLSSVDIVKIDSPGTNNEESVNQNVNSVINANGVNSDSFKKLRAKYSIKRTHDVANDTEVDNSSASGNSLKEDVAKDIALELHTTPPAEISSANTEKMGIKQHAPFRIAQPAESSPTKLDFFAKSAPPQSSTATTIVKPSIAFKQQLANKLKGLDPSPTAPMIVSEESLVEAQEKPFTKLPTKSSLRKKPKPDYHTSSSSETYIPPTATAWTLVSMKSVADNLRSSQKPSTSLDTSPSPTSTSARQTTIPPVTRVKSFVPWSTRLLRSTTTTQPSTSTSNGTLLGEYGFDGSEISSKTERMREAEQPKSPESSSPSSSTEDQYVIRTTQELDRNMSETSDNFVQNTGHDFMVKDQSSTASRGNKNIVGRSTTEETSVLINATAGNSSGSDPQAMIGERDNVIETRHLSEESSSHNSTEEKSLVDPQEAKPSNVTSKMNEVAPATSTESVNEIKPVAASMNMTSGSTTSTTMASILEIEKIKNLTDAELDSVHSDILVDGTGDEGKSEEENEDDDKLKQTTLPPVFEPFETTVINDLDEDVESENDREDDELPIIIDKLSNNQTMNVNSTMHNATETYLNPKPTNVVLPEVNSTGTYVTSFDIVSKDNTTQVVTKTPSEGDINWYNVDTKPGNSFVETTTPKTVTVEATTMEAATTNNPEPTTEVKEQETTLTPDTTEPVPTTAMPPRPTAPTTAEPTEAAEAEAESETVDDPSACVRIIVLVSPLKLCLGQRQLRQSIATQLMEDVSWQQIQVVSKRLQDCEGRKLSETEEHLDVDVCFLDKEQEPSPAIRDEFLRLYAKRAYDSSFPIVEVQMIVQPTAMTGGFDNVLAAIILSVIAAICLVLLGILLVIIRKRQGRFNYGQRCTPVSLDDYSLDNISVYNSVRRKGALRASKRSYGNPAFDDPGAPSHSVNFAGLANFSSDRDALDEEFNQVPMITVKADELPPRAESKNRYANVIPLPETRVPLQVKEGADSLTEYINANYIKGPKGQDKLYIACQAPLQSTVEDFWRMVWQQQTKVILMLTALNENGVEKCADYLPQLEISDCHRLFGDFQVTLKNHEVREKYIISTLQLKNLETNLWREVTHLWYSSWPSQGVPEDGSAMIAFLIEARSYMRGAQGPTVVHCSPGTGRTGTVIAIDLCIRDFETQRTVDIPKTVYALRRDRAGAVQTKDQYAFIYQVLNLYATKLTGGVLDSI